MKHQCMMELDSLPFPWFLLLPNLFRVLPLDYVETPFTKTFFVLQLVVLDFYILVTTFLKMSQFVALFTNQICLLSITDFFLFNRWFQEFPIFICISHVFVEVTAISFCSNKMSFFILIVVIQKEGYKPIWNKVDSKLLFALLWK